MVDIKGNRDAQSTFNALAKNDDGKLFPAWVFFLMVVMFGLFGWNYLMDHRLKEVERIIREDVVPFKDKHNGK